MSVNCEDFKDLENCVKGLGLRVYLVRHAESLNNVEGEQVDDPRLSHLGHQQAQRLVKYFEEERERGTGQVCKIYCSAMVRALQTCKYLQVELGIAPRVWLDVHEVKGFRGLDKGYKGVGRSQVEREFEGFGGMEGLGEDGWFFIGDLESEQEGWERAGKVWEKLRLMGNMEKYQGKSIIIISHGLFLDYLIGRICGRVMKGGNFYLEPRYIFSNAGVSLLWIKKNKPFFYFMDRIQHLAGLPV